MPRRGRKTALRPWRLVLVATAAASGTAGSWPPVTGSRNSNSNSNSKQASSDPFLNTAEATAASASSRQHTRSGRGWGAFPQSLNSGRRRGPGRHPQPGHRLSGNGGAEFVPLWVRARGGAVGKRAQVGRSLVEGEDGLESGAEEEEQDGDGAEGDEEEEGVDTAASEDELPADSEEEGGGGGSAAGAQDGSVLHASSLGQQESQPRGGVPGQDGPRDLHRLPHILAGAVHVHQVRAWSLVLNLSAVGRVGWGGVQDAFGCATIGDARMWCCGPANDRQRCVILLKNWSLNSVAYLLPRFGSQQKVGQKHRFVYIRNQRSAPREGAKNMLELCTMVFVGLYRRLLRPRVLGGFKRQMKEVDDGTQRLTHRDARHSFRTNVYVVTRMMS